jgi:pilus assembly protein CpaB
MRPKSLLLLALALGCGLVASIGISQVMDRNNSPHVKLETVPIYVALHNINLGDPIDAKMLSLQEWPKDRVPHGAISTLEELQGRRPRTTIIEGEPILEGKLLNKGEMADPIRGITKGMRLFTVKVDAEKSAAGLLGPGDRVDVQLFVRKDQRTGVETAKSKIILQNVRVYAVDQSVQRSADGGEERSVAKTISLLLKPEQASKLSLATQVGEISLIPRNPDDEDQAQVAETTVEELLKDGEINSRSKEQGVTAKEQPVETNSNSSGAGLIEAIKTVVAPKGPYRMEIVEAQAVREVFFDGSTGRPIRQGSENAGAAGPTIHPPAVGPSPTAGDSKSDDGKSGDKMLEEFPIDFNQPK